MRTIHCFFSGGRDSALACYIAFQVARRRGWRFVLIHIDTTVSIWQTKEYVRYYAQWLGVELVALRPKRTFKEYVAQYGMWPALQPQRFRWCYFKLKLEPITEYLEQEYKEGDIVVIGVKQRDSDYRRKRYTSVFFTRDYGGRLKVYAWSPVLYLDNYTIERLINRFGIPRSPVWKILGASGECLCLAGTPLDTVALILLFFPEEREMLLEVDDIIQKHRKSGKPSAPPSVWRAGFETLKKFYEHIRKQQTLDQWLLPYRGKACQGSCML
jgi:3'-phosphoadenosine 5'-phosphosulfate sulfotransferase (PAPS reductase)/FAD synthetase